MANASPFAPSFPRNYLPTPVPPSARPLLTSPKPLHNFYHAHAAAAARPTSSSSANAVGKNYHSVPRLRYSSKTTTCKAAEASSSVAEASSENWVPVVPLAALPKGERRVIVQDGEAILLLWYKDEVFAIENRSPAEGAYTEGLLNAKLTQVGLNSQPHHHLKFSIKSTSLVNHGLLIWLTCCLGWVHSVPFN